MLIIKNPTVTVKCRTAIKALFLYFNLCPSVKLGSLSCSYYTSISFLTNSFSVFFVQCGKTFPHTSISLLCVIVYNHLFIFLCSPIMCLYVLSSMLWCPLWFPYCNDVQFVFTLSCLWEDACLVYVVSVCLRLVLSGTYCVWFCFVFLRLVASFSG